MNTETTLVYCYASARVRRVAVPSVKTGECGFQHGDLGVFCDRPAGTCHVPGLGNVHSHGTFRHAGFVSWTVRD